MHLHLLPDPPSKTERMQSAVQAFFDAIMRHPSSKSAEVTRIMAEANEAAESDDLIERLESGEFDEPKASAPDTWPDDRYDPHRHHSTIDYMRCSDERCTAGFYARAAQR